MKNLAYIAIILAITTFALSIAAKFTDYKLIAGIGATGYLSFTMLLLLLAANFSLFGIINKK